MRCTHCVYRGFESLTFRKKRKEYSSTRSALFFLKRQGLLQGSTTGVIQNQIQTIWDGFYNYNHKNFPNPYSSKKVLEGLHFFAPQPNSIPQFNINQLQNIGSIYGCPCYIAPLIWGPYTWNNLASNIVHTFQLQWVSLHFSIFRLKIIALSLKQRS